MKDELANLDATAQAELVRKKEATPLELWFAATPYSPWSKSERSSGAS
jgi:hypothetical protein